MVAQNGSQVLHEVLESGTCRIPEGDVRQTTTDILRSRAYITESSCFKDATRARTYLQRMMTRNNNNNMYSEFSSLHCV